MNNNKIKVIKNKKDAIIFLNQLIILTDKRMMRLKRALKDLEKFLSTHVEYDTKIPTDVYHRYSESIECTSDYLLNLLGDETKTAVSYKQFRNVIEKQKKHEQLDFQLDKLEPEIVNLLNNIRNMRNWSHHVAQSLFNSQIEYMEKVSKIPKPLVEAQFSQADIHVLTWEYHEIDWLKELLEKSTENYEMFSKVFQRMKKDYSKLIGTSVRISREKQMIARPYKFNLISEKSFDINTGKKK
ncbi:hypothetical protein ACSW93_06395 [Clostridium perfringens]|uniref:hypothetical protein n=1 Tax=Clostridium perfringens TaxID=1502 RepID=UPI000D715EA6|nr:hypothetical protein [Clostridium perfringens]PWX08373.1 hypothetical protein CYK70_07160 [Clostridium perfringens]